MSRFARRIRPFVEAELQAARDAADAGQAFAHLERAHVLGQGSTLQHVRVHWRMLRWGLEHGRLSEVAGQAWRLIGAATKTAIGLVPHGNTGGSNVSGWRTMPVPADLQRRIDAARGRFDRRALPSPAACSTRPAIPAVQRLLITALPLLALLVATGCSTPPPELDLSLRHPSAGGKFVVALQPPATPAAINQLHAWTVSVSSPAGVPVRQAHIVVDGGMPQHGHGLPTRPQVTRELADGSYLLEGMKFSMTGWWQIRLAIETPEATDKATFNTIVATTAR
jgi:hypothetical protein